MKRAASVAVTVLLASLIGCYSDASIEPSPPPDPSTSATARPTVPATPTVEPSPTFEPVGTLVPPIARAEELLYFCHTIGFPPSALAGIGVDQSAGHPAAAALREFFTSYYATIALFPATGWHFLGESLENAEFGQLAGNPDGPVIYVRFDRNAAGYTLGGWGDCWPRLAAPPGRLALEWWLPDLAQPPNGAVAVTVNAVALGCAGGPELNLIGAPETSADDQSIAIALTAHRVDGQTGCEKAGCGVIASTSVDIDIPAGVGARRLLDASTWPARDATTEPSSLRGCGG